MSPKSFLEGDARLHRKFLQASSNCKRLIGCGKEARWFYWLGQMRKYTEARRRFRLTNLKLAIANRQPPIQ